MAKSKIKEKFGFKIGDICKLSEAYFKHNRLEHRRERQFKVVGFGEEGRHSQSILVKRLGIFFGKTEYLHHTFLEKLIAVNSH